jgi:hypothetical protein
MRQPFARTPRNVRKAPARFRPQLESLESRYVPSTLMVTNTSDTGVSGDGSLRGELAAAASGDTIAFAGSLKGKTITLSHGELALSQSLTIAGPVANPVTISGNQASRVFDITSSSAIVTLSGLTITQGHAGEGGGIYNTGTLTVSQCTLSDNSASVLFGVGGGIYNRGTLTVSQCSLSGNRAVDVGGVGGGIYNARGTVTVSQSSLSGNSASEHGGGILNAFGTLTVSQSSLSDNSAFQGGGIDNTGTVTVSQSSLSGNSASGGYGGGILNVFGTVTVSQSSLSDNAAFEGGGIYNEIGATLNVLNHSSITGNTPDDVQNHGKLNQDKSSTIGVLD